MSLPFEEWHPVPQVTMDSQGLMRVTHMLKMEGSGDEAHGGHYASEAAFLDSQRTAAQQRVAILHFILLSEDAAGDEDDGL